MIADDPLLPAAAHLVGPEADGLLRAAVEAAGGHLESAHMVQVQYRPGHDLVARYDAQVGWRGEPAKAETLLAGVTAEGPFAGTLPMEAGDLVAGVWRYPFDPELPGLGTAVTPKEVEALLGHLLPGPLRIDVRAYRPVRRAVARVQGSDGHEVYVKVVRPREAPRIIDRHRTLRDAGLPVPEVLLADADAGVLVLEGLSGESLRDRLMGSTSGWPPASDLRTMMDGLATVPAPSAPDVDPAGATAAHAAAIAAMLPGEQTRLDRIVEAVSRVEPTSASDAVTIHGDLYEAQLMVEGDRIAGLLDLDDVGPGNRLDDVATMLGHLHILQPETRRHREHLARYRNGLRTSLAAPGDLPDLDLRTAAVLVGLATGPFRAQTEAWQREVRRRIGMAVRLTATAGEKTLRTAS